MAGDATSDLSPARTALVSRLKTCEWRTWFEEGRKKRPTLYRAVCESVAGTTFRAFRGHPSEVFRGWALIFLTDGGLETFVRTNDRARFDKWAELASASLRRYWNKRSPQNLAYGHSRKLLDLLLKRLCLCVEVGDLDSVAKCLHVPLDSYSLRLIRPHARKAVIPADASMGFIRDRSTYHAVQHDIREICGEAGVPPIAFDLLAWDEEHHTYATAVGLR